LLITKIKKLLVIISLLIPLTGYAFFERTSTVSGTTPISSEIITHNITVAEPTIEELVRESALKYNVSFDELWYTIGCETQQTYNPYIQSNIRYAFTDTKRGIVKGERELSFGLAMIHLPDHPEITYEQATDKYFAIDFIAKNWSKHSGWWYAWVNKACTKK